MKKTLSFLCAALLGIAASAQVAFFEDFESVAISNSFGDFPAGWVTYSDNCTNFSNSQADYTVFGQSWRVFENSDFGKLAFAISYTQEGLSGTPVDRWMVTPEITIPGDSYGLLFDTYTSQYPEALQVLVSTTGDAKTDFTNVLLDIPSLSDGAATKFADLSAYNGQTIRLAFVLHSVDGLYIGIDNITVREMNEIGISLTSVTAPSRARMSQSFDMSVTVRNEGIQPMTSFDVVYSVNGGTEQTEHVSAINVAPFDNYTHTVSLTLADEGLANINVTVQSPNGGTDPDASDNSGSCAVSVIDPSTMVDRNVLLENFTTAVCPNCPSGHERVNQAVRGYENQVAWVAHHCGYYTDDLTIAASEALMTMYNSNSTYAPAIAIDRNHDLAATEGEPGTIFFPQAVDRVRNLIEEALETYTGVTCEIENLNYNTSSRELKFTVSGRFASAYAEGLRVTVYVVEDNIVGTQAGAGSNYVHNHVVRAALTANWGDADIITSSNAGDTYSREFSYTVPETSRPNNTYVVAFVSNYDARDVNNRAVANTAFSPKLTSVGIDDVQPTVKVNTYPNPTTDMAYISAESMIRNIEVVNTLGQKVYAQQNVNADVVELNVSGYETGVYFVTVTTDRGSSTERLSVVR